MTMTSIVFLAVLAQSVTSVSAKPNGNGSANVRVIAPQAKSVGVRVDTMPQGQVVSLTRGDNGVWTGTLGPLAPDLYPMAYVIDGFMGYANYIQITGPTPEAWDPRPVPHGVIHRQWYDSKALGVPRSAVIYTPPGYAGGTQKYPVLYLLHGSGGTELAWVDEGAINVMLDNLIADRKAVPMIVVMPFGHSESSVRPGNDPTYTGRDQAKFAKELFDELIPMIERDYRVAAGPDRRAIAGFSMGGVQARQIGLAHPELFRSIGTFSGSLAGVADLAPEVIDATFADLRVFFMGVGDQEGNLVSQHRALSASLIQRQIHHTFALVPGGHTYHVWRRNFRDFVQLLFR
jgi:enterochelin esterase family protein